LERIATRQALIGGERKLKVGKSAAIIVAGGMGTRMGSPVMKQLILFDDKPVLTHTLLAFEKHSEVDELVLVVPKGAVDEVMKLAVTPYGFTKIQAVIEGGEHRQASVWAGLNALDSAVEWVLIHDGARPLVSAEVIGSVISGVSKEISAISGVKTKDTIKITNENAQVLETSPREVTWMVQTPQAFSYQLIMSAHKQALHKGFIGTDDSVLVERIGGVVKMVEGDYANIKLTTPEDMYVAEALHRFKAYSHQRKTP